MSIVICLSDQIKGFIDMQAQSEKTMLIAVRNGRHLSVLERLAAPETGYQCLSRYDPSLKSYLDLNGVRADRPDETEMSVAQLLALEEAFGTLDPAAVLEPEDAIAGNAGLDTGFGLSLALCFYADFFRYSIAQAQAAQNVLRTDPSAPLDLRPLIPVFESALALDCAHWCKDYLDRNGDAIHEALSDPDRLQDIKGNGSYATRLIADLEERLDRPSRAIAALEVSCRLGVNSKKLSRLILLNHAEKKFDMASKHLNAYEKSYRLGPRLKAIKSELG